jgi:hypothetical protein
MSKAKDMFEQIGYSIVEYEEGIYMRYESNLGFGKYTYFVSFFIDKEEFTIGVRKGNWEKQIVERFDFEIIEPITQQMKELGWIK